VNVDTVPRTLAVAALVALLCSAMVSAAVNLLRPVQLGYALVDRNRTILEAAGTLPTGEVGDREITAAFLELEAYVVDLDSGEYLPALDGHSFDHWIGAEPGEAAEPGDDTANRAPVYIVRRAGTIERLVLPVHGPGMWSTIYAYVALDRDLATIRDIVFYRHAETPGIGDRIEAPEWRAQWRGKKLYDDTGAVCLRVTRQGDDRCTVDLISGASVTAEAVGTLVREWFGQEYRPYLERLRAREGI
jgi:Na+-transporting NADH:ubiquinone oxidoreductase subunit C